MRMSFWRALMQVSVLALIVLPGTAFAQYEVFSEPTRIGLVASMDPDAPGHVSLRAELSSAVGTGVADGRITFIDMTTLQVLGWTSVAQPQITAQGLAPGRHMLRADYSGSAAHLPLIILPSQSAEVPLDVTMQPALTLSSSSELIAPGDLVTFVVTVSGDAGVAGGCVTFRDGESVIAARVPLDHAGTAAFTTSALSSGSRTIVVQYDGDTRYAKATAQIEQQVTSPLAAVERR
ncbi:Ig-like domain-containing protein [Rhodopseudomonas telluris]|uniref:Ig-like domain-containing protein n=1 Tax=Rhodopseudomonas telluris TaxID=644215 RepID=A0ABV6ETK9_9BRAD